MLNKDEEIGLFEILKANFPNLLGRSLVISQNEFLTDPGNLEKFICKDKSAKELAAEYIKENIPYIVLDETEGYKCLFFKGNFLKIQYDVTHSTAMQFQEL